MSFFMRQRVEEDLERIRKANQPPKPGEGQPGVPEASSPPAEAGGLGRKRARPLRRSENGVPPLEKGDFLAMVLAAFAIIGPYVLIFMGVLGAIVLGLWLWMS